MRLIRSSSEAFDLLREVGASAWLVRHHELVAEAARELSGAIIAAHGPILDAAEVEVGAALHDVGKTRFPAEMTGPGSHHEAAGQALLESLGVPPSISRHCILHASWRDTTDLEPLVVALSDKLWKGKRVDALEEAVVHSVASASESDFWTVYATLTACFEAVASRAGERLERSRV
ncbi:MAG: hypothetical protein ACI8S6_005311 [Myxococcota bacterium]|jgi:hypothetical protein